MDAEVVSVWRKEGRDPREAGEKVEEKMKKGGGDGIPDRWKGHKCCTVLRN